MEIAEFLLARIAEDEERATFVQAQQVGQNWSPFEPWRLSWQDEYDLLCIEPARVLAECEAKRRIVGWHKTLDEWVTSNDPLAMSPACDQIQTIEQVMEAMSRVYADHSDYDPEWKP